MKVYIVENNIKACYDCGGIFEGVFATKELAEEYISKYDKSYSDFFDILEEEI